jgi:hypothetical protein
MRVVALGLVVWAIALSAAGAAPTCGCSTPRVSLVARGTSPHGVRWRITAQVTKHALQIDFGFLPPGYDDAGYGTTLTLPLSAGPWITANAGSDLDPFMESDISGITTRGVVKLIVRMNDGTKLVLRPRLAPRAARTTHRPLAQLRFFEAFYPPAREPRSIVGVDAHGHIQVKQRI